MKTYISLSQPIKESKELRISTGYELGGYGGMDWTLSKRGFYVYLVPVLRIESDYGTMSERSIMYGIDKHESGFKMLILEMKRANAKTQDAISLHVLENALKITELYEKRDYNAIKELVTTT